MISEAVLFILKASCCNSSLFTLAINKKFLQLFVNDTKHLNDKKRPLPGSGLYIL